MSGFKKYFLVLFITIALFGGAWYASRYLNNRKIAEIKDAQEQVTVDIMSSETQFDLLEAQSCQDISNNYLSQEISDLADKLSYAEQNIGDQSQITLLKQQYSILEVKDFLLNKQISQRCKSNIATILYFYKNQDVCADCVRQGYVLDALRQTYPQVRIYSFDAGLDSSTVRALLTIYKIPSTLPSLVIDGKTVNGFLSVDALKKYLPTTITTPPKTTSSTAKKTSPSVTQTAAVAQ